jgi:hypothetical protein
MRSLLLMLVLSAAGCYSTTLHGDADSRTDTGADTPVDTGADTSVPDTEADVPPDAPPDAMGPCEPAGDGVWLTWMLDGAEWDEDREIDIPCQIDLVRDEDDGSVTVFLVCGTGGLMERHTLSILSSPRASMDVWEGAELMLNYVSRNWGEVNERWVTLRWFDGGIFFAAVSAVQLAPPGREVDEWYMPLNVYFLHGYCPQVDDGCGPWERAALEVHYMGDRELVFDGNSGFVGGVAVVEVLVADAIHFEYVICPDLPGDRVHAMFLMLPEG